MRLLANLDILAIRDGEVSTGLFTPDQTKKGNYAIVLNILENAAILAHIDENLTRDNLETILAHELGHFVANVFQDPTHKEETIKKAWNAQNGKLLVPTEIKAWDIAEIIKPDLNKPIRDYATNSYRHAKPEVIG